MLLRTTHKRSCSSRGTPALRMGFSHPSKEMCAWATAQENDIQLLDPSLGPKLEALKGEGGIHKRGRWEGPMAM